LKSLGRPQTEASRVGETGRNSFISLSRDLQERALTTLVRAEEAEELNVALRAIREARGNLELLAKLLDELDERA
jgi:hypothetical protein